MNEKRGLLLFLATALLALALRAAWQRPAPHQEVDGPMLNMPAPMPLQSAKYSLPGSMNTRGGPRG